MNTKDNRILLHMCCGVCASWPIQKLREDGYEPIGFFYNPNIHPKAEYLRRYEAARKVCELLGVQMIEGVYDADSWLMSVPGLENEKEGGKRCDFCFRGRLAETAQMAKKLGIGAFTTTLTVSPHKDSKIINQIGEETGGASFIRYDFKKKDGFKRARQYARENDIFCQSYCGCVFSIKKKG